jgi:hypothetical protein
MFLTFFENSHNVVVFGLDLAFTRLWLLICKYNCVSLFCAFIGRMVLSLRGWFGRTKTYLITLFRPRFFSISCVFLSSQFRAGRMRRLGGRYKWGPQLIPGKVQSPDTLVGSTYGWKCCLEWLWTRNRVMFLNILKILTIVLFFVLIWLLLVCGF